MKPFMGYPGGKSRAAARIIEMLDLRDSVVPVYAEPFAGGFGFGLRLSDTATMEQIIVNDVDTNLCCLWTAVLHHTEAFCDRIMHHQPTAADFYTLRDVLKHPRPMATNTAEVLARALDKLVVHKISYSNMGEMSGSPVGGKNQTGRWKFDCRWNPASICRAIRRVADRLGRATVTCHSYQRILENLGPGALVFVDPPYVDAGQKCYKHAFTEADHVELAECLHRTKADWILTYDTHKLILDLYSDCRMYDLQFNYFMSSAYRSGQAIKIGTELLITNHK